MSEEEFIFPSLAHTNTKSISGSDSGALRWRRRGGGGGWGGGGVTTGFSIIHLFAAEGITAPSILICAELKAVTTTQIQRLPILAHKTRWNVFLWLEGSSTKSIPCFLLYADGLKSHLFTTWEI